jgi:sugar lactone lactonase YvrE
MRFTTGSATVLPADRARVFYDGVFAEPRLAHPEGVAVAPDGAVWCGTETGDILRISPDGSGAERMAATGGFILGLAFGADALYACDQRFAAVFRLDLVSGALRRFTPAGIRIPNYPVVDRQRGRLYVSDSHAFGTPGPGVWAYDLITGEGALWFGEPMTFANGMALAPDRRSLLVIETFARQVTRIMIGDDGAPAGRETVVTDLPGLPDGLAFDRAGVLYVSCYEPSRILRVQPGGRVDVYAEDVTAHTLCHPTNIAVHGAALYAANLGRWHITRIETDTVGDILTG